MKESDTEMRLKNLPFIPSRIRKFAYQYALQCKKTREAWALEFNVKSNVIDRWLRHAGVRDYISIVRETAREKTDYLQEIRGRLKDKVTRTG